MYKPLSEMNLISSNGTRKSQRRNKLANATSRILGNKKAENLILTEEYNEYKEDMFKESINNFRNSSGYNKRRYISEKMNFKRTVKDELFNEFVSDMVIKSLVMNEEEKKYLEENIKIFTEAVINEYKNQYGLNYEGLSKKSTLLEDIIALCENTAKKASDEEFKDAKTYNKGKQKILNELDKDTELKEYDDVKEDKKTSIKSDTKAEYENEKQNTIESLKNEIKERVIDTIQQEKEKNKSVEVEKQEIMDSVETIEKYSMTDELQPLSTAANAAMGQDNTPSIDEDEVDNKEVKPTSGARGSATVSESAYLKHIPITRNRKKPVLSIYGTFMNEYGKKLFLQEASNAYSVNTDINMDTVMLNSLISQTILESMTTLGFVNTSKEIRDLANIIIKVNK